MLPTSFSETVAGAFVSSWAKRKPKVNLAMVRPSSAAWMSAASSWFSSQALQSDERASFFGWSLMSNSFAWVVNADSLSASSNKYCLANFCKPEKSRSASVGIDTKAPLFFSHSNNGAWISWLAGLISKLISCHLAASCEPSAISVVANFHNESQPNPKAGELKVSARGILVIWDKDCNRSEALELWSKSIWFWIEKKDFSSQIKALEGWMGVLNAPVK